MVTRNQNNLVRVTVTLDPHDVDLLDRLAALVDSNRSEQIRDMLLSLRPMLEATVKAYESAGKSREELLKAAASATVDELAAIAPEVEQLQRQVLGMMSRLEGAAAASVADAPASNTGATDS